MVGFACGAPSMPLSPDHRTNLLRLRSAIAGLSVTICFVRAQRALSRKYDPSQPREPAGSPNGGGRWTSNGGSQWTSGTEEIVTEDGSRVLSLRIRSHPSQEWDEQHTVTAPDGTRTIFEMAGRTQTIRDGETGEILSRSTLTASGVEPEAFLQNVRAPMPGPSRFVAAVEAGRRVLGVLSQRVGGGPAIFVAPASEYKRGEDPSGKAIWVGEVDQPELDEACPRNREVQSLLDETMAKVKNSGLYFTPQAIGKRVHKLMAEDINSQHDPDFVAEISYDNSTGEPGYYSKKNTVRLDVLDHTPKNSTVCVYDPKTGEKGIEPRKAVDYVTAVQRNFPDATRFILMEMRPPR